MAESPAISSRPSPIKIWLLAARPRTLPAGVAPVLVGTALAVHDRVADWTLAGGCLTAALLVQIGCNFANDAFDALKGADTAERIGPRRAVASGLISARAMLTATALVLAAALGVGIWLSTAGGGWPIIALGVVSVLCAVGYTAGPFPLAYVGLGDLFVFLFFGLVAVLGTLWVQGAAHGQGALHTGAILVAEAVGLQATGIIAVNNLRDRAGDAAVGKRTLAVRLGDRATRGYILGLHVTAMLCLVLAAWVMRLPALLAPAALAGIGGGLLGFGVARTHGAALNAYLARSAALELLTGAGLAAVLMLAAR